MFSPLTSNEHENKKVLMDAGCDVFSIESVVLIDRIRDLIFLLYKYRAGLLFNAFRG